MRRLPSTSKMFLGVAVLVLTATAALITTIVTAGHRAPGSAAVQSPKAHSDSAATSTPGSHRYLYTIGEGNVEVFDIDHDMSRFGTISLRPTSRHGIRGVAASPSNHTLYVAYGGDGGEFGNGSLLAYDLVTRQVIWTRSYAHGIDSMAITPDGKTIYMPDGELASDGKWHLVDALTGDETGTVIDTGAGSGDHGPHNTIVGLSGRHVYMGDRNLDNRGSNYFYVADTSTNMISKRVGPFKSGIRPFTVNRAETLVYTSVTGFLGFQIGDLTTGHVLQTVPIDRPRGASCGNSGASDPSHGVSLSPDEQELYVIDYPCNYVHVFDVSRVPSAPARQVADIPVHQFDPSQPSCSYDCLGDGWLLHSRDGRFVFVGDSGSVIDTRIRRVVADVTGLYDTRIFLEIDWQDGQPVLTTTRSGLGYVAA